MMFTFPVLAISEGKRFTGIWACTDETGYCEGSRGSFDAGCWDNLELIDRSGRMYRIIAAKIERVSARWWQRLIPVSARVTIACTLTQGTDADLGSVKKRIVRMVDDDEEGFREMRALYHGDDFDMWRLQVAQAESFDALIALFLTAAPTR